MVLTTELSGGALTVRLERFVIFPLFRKEDNDGIYS